MFKQSKVFLALLAYFVKQVVILNIGFGFCVFNSIWEHTLNVFLTFFRSRRRRRRRRVPSSSSCPVVVVVLCPSVRPVVRPVVVVVRPLPVRPRPSSSSVLCPSVRLVFRPVVVVVRPLSAAPPSV